MASAIDPEATDAFWAWFAATIAPAWASLSDELVAAIDARVDALAEALGPLDWEIGPHDGRTSYFALSPAGDRTQLTRTRAIVARAPTLDGWQFLPAKPPRSWMLQFTVATPAGEVAIDGGEWECVLRRRGGHMLVDLRPPSAPALTDDDAATAAYILVDGELGEQARLEHVEDVAIVRGWSAREEAVARRLVPGLLARMLGVAPR